MQGVTDGALSVSEFFISFIELEGAAPIRDALDSVRDGESAVALALAFLASLFVAVFGRRAMPIIRFVLVFSLGYVLGVAFLAPAVCEVIPQLSGMTVGTAVGAVAALLARPIYFLLYSGAFFIAAYHLTVCVLSQDSGVGAVAAILALMTALIMRRHIEIFLTAALGALGVAEFAAIALGYGSMLGSASPTLIFVLPMLAIPAAVIQYKTARAG